MSILADVGGDYPPFLLFNAESGELIWRPFDEALGERVPKTIELGSLEAKFAVDTATVERGYGKVRQGFRDFVLSPLGSPPPEQPDDDDYKPAVGLAVWNKPLGEMRIETCATIYRGAVCAVIERASDFPEAARGLIPVILFADRREITIKSVGKTFWSPVINVVGWLERDSIPAFRLRKPTVLPPPEPEPKPTLVEDQRRSKALKAKYIRNNDTW
jgi:hypothetical protein